MRYLGAGLGLRPPFYSQVMNGLSKSKWFEVIAENYFPTHIKGEALGLGKLLKIREKYPIVLHGVSLNIGSTDDLNLEHLQKLKVLAETVLPEWISDHICWTGVNGRNLHDLLPLPMTKAAVENLVKKIDQAQAYLQRPLVFENVSSYFKFKTDEMPEWEFLNQITSQTGCKLLFDVNNVFVSSVNQQFDPLDYINGINGSSIVQYHLGGPIDKGGFFIDTHDHDIRDEVWSLFERTISLYGPKSTLIERDDNWPDFVVLEEEVIRAQRILDWHSQKGQTQTENSL